MKTIFITLLVSLFSLSAAEAQDTIVKKTGEIIQVKIMELTPIEIKYKTFDFQEGPTFSILKSDVSVIKYENGVKEVFNEEPQKQEGNHGTSDMFMKGQKDALRYYKGFRPASTGTLITSLLSPLAGLIPAIACSSTTPKMQNLTFPDYNLMKNPDYKLGYVFAAKKIKKQKVWTNFGIGLGVNIVALIIIESQNHK